MAMMAALLDMLPANSADGVDKLYRQLEEILAIAAALQKESSLQHWAGVSIPSTGRSRAGWQKTTVVGIASSQAWVSAQDPPRHPGRCTEP
jgi:hypothetical protein